VLASLHFPHTEKKSGEEKVLYYVGGHRRRERGGGPLIRSPQKGRVLAVLCGRQDGTGLTAELAAN